MSGKATKSEKKKIEQMKNKLEVQQQKFQTEQRKHAKAVKELGISQKQLQKEQKQLKISQKLFEQESRAQGIQRARNSKSGGGNNFKEQFFSMKRKCDGESKKNRELRKRVAQLEAENKVLKRKLSNSAGKRKNVKDPRIIHLSRENKYLKRRLKKLLKELNRKQRWLTRNINIFRKNQTQWVDRQKKVLKDRQFIIKYIFVDDIKKIMPYRKKGKNNYDFANRIRIKSRDGGETVLKDVQIVILDADDIDIDLKAKNTKNKKKKTKGKGKDENEDSNGKKKKKRKKSKLEKAEEMEDYMNELMKEFNLENAVDVGDEDDMKSLESSDTESESELSEEMDQLGVYNKGGSPSIDMADSAALEAQIMYLTQEMESRAGDLETLKNIMNNTAEHPNPSEDVQQLVRDMDSRQSQMMSNLQSVNAEKTEAVQQSNEQWNKWILKLANTIEVNAQQFASLLKIADQFLVELQGRTIDMNKINDVFYNEEKNDGEIGFNGLKNGVNERHSEIEKQLMEEDAEEEKKEKEVEVEVEVGVSDDEEDKQAIEENKAKIKAIYNSLVNENKNWNGLLNVSGDKFNESLEQRKRLVNALIDSQTVMNRLIKNVNILPSRLVVLEEEDEVQVNNSDIVEDVDVNAELDVDVENGNEEEEEEEVVEEEEEEANEENTSD